MCVKCVISLKCHFLKYHALYLHGACGLLVCDCREQLEQGTTRRHPAASSAVPQRGPSRRWKACVNLPLLASASGSVATRAGSASGWALWESHRRMQGRGCLPSGRKVCTQSEGVPPESPSRWMGWHGGHPKLSPSHLLVLLQKRSRGSASFHCTVKGNSIFGKCWVIKCRFPCPMKPETC